MSSIVYENPATMAAAIAIQPLDCEAAAPPDPPGAVAAKPASVKAAATK